MKPINLILWASTLTSYSVLASEKMSLEDAAKKGLIKLSIKGKGGFTGDVIDMKINNLTNKVLNLKLEAGRRLDSKNQEEQDILVTKNEEFVLAANQQKNMKVFGMCCQANNHSPKPNSVYTIGKMGDSVLVKLAKFIDSSKYYSNSTAQDAVWAISDNKSIGGISGSDEKEVSALKNYVSKITGRPIPKYDVKYGDGSSTNVMGRATRIDAIFNYTLDDNGKVSVGIYDSNGNLVQVIEQTTPHEKGEYKLYYVFRTRNLNSGTYYTRLMQNGEVKKEEAIEF